MKLYPISSNYTFNFSRNKNEDRIINTEKPQSVEQTNLSLMPHYTLYNVRFTGRTPEDFYAQDFNRENMPSTMKDYLYSDYDKWQHVPPEQLMSKSFEYLEIADNFEEVKDLYPNEPLFMNLKDAGRAISSVAYEIKTAKELSDEPVFKSGDDNFGIYLLRKIYLEGKTIKEIDKDFYDKDLNPVYKGVITKPITKETFRLYGIRYPESAFWNSFIATRDEYKKFFVSLPKNENLETLKRVKTGTKSEISTSSVNYKKAPQPRKYKIKEYKLNQFAKEVEDAKGDLRLVEIKLKRRYGKDDPETSFFLKYMSPIMTLVADRIHLSEAMRDFHDLEAAKGIIGDDEVKLARFWKHNPVVLKDLSKTIPSTIQMFEEAYGVGGDIPINKNLEIVIPEMDDNVIIDKVSSEFIELLNYTQKIESNRLKKYAKHDELQDQWQKHFVDKYGEVEKSEDIAFLKPSVTNRTDDINDLNTPKVFTSLEDALKERAYALPRKFADKYIKDFMHNPNISEEYKNEILHQYYAFVDYEKDVVSNNDINYNNDYFFANDMEAYAAMFTYGDLAHKYLLDEPSRITGISDYFNLCFGNFFDARGRETGIFIDDHRLELNSLYNNYTKPLTSKEALQVTNLILDNLMNLAIDDDYQASGREEAETFLFSMMLSDMAKLDKGHKKAIKDTILNAVSINCPYSRALLNDKDFSKEINFKRFLGLMNAIYTKLYLTNPSLFCCTFNKETVHKYINYFSPEMQEKISELLKQANSNEQYIYCLSNDEIKQGAVRNYRLKRN